jgi:glycosyltransferase involved in cell wall biosynthesis
MPKVTIIVPVHNTEAYLQACVASLTAQTLADIEILLVENCSTDNSLEVCNNLAQGDNRIKVLSIDQADLSTARNEGVKVASGEYVGFVDSDDTVLPEMYGDMYELAVQHDLGVVNCSFVMTYDNRKDKYPYVEDGRIDILDAKAFTTLNLTDKISRVVCTLLIRKELFEKLSFPTYMYHEDRASTHLFMAACGKGANVSRAYYKYYQRSSSIMHTGSFRRMRDFILATCLRLEFINSSEFYSMVEKPVVARRCAEQLLRKLRHLLRLASTPEEREEALGWCRKIELIPQGTHLPLKARLIRWYIQKFVI